MLKIRENSFVIKYRYWILSVILGLNFIANLVFCWYLLDWSRQPTDQVEKITIFEMLDTATNDLAIDSIETLVAEEERDNTTKEKISSKKEPQVTEENFPENQRFFDIAPSSSISATKKLKVNDVKDIARTLKSKSISAKTIIQEINRIVTSDNYSAVTGATIVKALGHKLPKNTKDKLINHVKKITVADNKIFVKLKDAQNIKLTFKTDEGKKTIRVYDNAVINIDNNPSRVSAIVSGFSYQHLGMYWKIKDLEIEEVNQKGTLDIQLKGRLKDINLPTIALGNIHRKMM